LDPKNILNPGKVLPKPLDSDNDENSGNRPVVIKSREISSTEGVTDLMDKIKTAAAQKQAVVPAGSGSYSWFGNSTAGDPQTLDSRALTDVIEYDSANQVITVGAGMPFKAVQAHLQKQNQWLPVRPPFFTASSTIGRLVALAPCGPERMIYGAPRDLLLGLRYINSSGQLISGGGRVVKNVAGYDITRLLTGSAGTLGFITEATLRVSTMPERCAAITAAGSLDACTATALEILKSNCQPVFVCGVPDSQAAADPNSWKLIIAFEGFSRTVDYQIEKGSAMLLDGQLKVLEQTEYPVHEVKFSEVYKPISQSAFILRGDFLLNRVADFIKALNDELPVSRVFSDYGCGRILAGIDELSNEQWSHIWALAGKHDGHVLLEKAPDEFKKHNDVFGLPNAAWSVMHKIKAELDPDSIFAPGRLPGKV
jgi:FAD/FMN-containing dehydrogenase